MPAPGDQHRGTSLANPFEERPPRISEYTARELATLQSRLEKQLGPEYISSREGPSGKKVHYLAAEKCIGLANEVFGFNGWSSAIRDVQVDFVDENTTTGKVSLGLSVIVRVTLRDGSHHEDIGYGHIENCKGKAAAFEKAKKEGTTDALKRALRNFGNILGNCVYDKDYLSRVTKMKVAPSKWDPKNLHRHSDFAPVKKEPVAEADSFPTVRGDEMEDEFGNFDEADFGVADTEHPDEVALERQSLSPIKQAHPNPSRRPQSMVQQPQPTPVLQPLEVPSRSLSSTAGAQTSAQQRPPPIPTLQPATNGPARPVSMARVQPTSPANLLGVGRAMPQPPDKGQEIQRGQPATVISTIAQELGDYKHDPNVGFCHARVAERLQGGDSSVLAAAAFDPKLESPSLRKTQGVDHAVSRPLQKPRAGPAPTISGPITRSNYVNPHLDPNRRIGMPTSNASPLQNRNTYKPPSMTKRGVDGASDTPPRPVLGDVTAATANVPPETPNDAKRVRTEPLPVPQGQATTGKQDSQ